MIIPSVEGCQSTFSVQTSVGTWSLNPWYRAKVIGCPRAEVRSLRPIPSPNDVAFGRNPTSHTSRSRNISREDSLLEEEQRNDYSSWSVFLALRPSLAVGGKASRTALKVLWTSSMKSSEQLTSMRAIWIGCISKSKGASMFGASSSLGYMSYMLRSVVLES